MNTRCKVTHLYFRKYTFAVPHAFHTLGYMLVAPAFLSITCIFSFSAIWRAVLASYSLFYSSLLVITVLYRVSPFHPLRKYPGPVLARVSKFWNFRMAASGKQHTVYKALHDTYGPIVRVGSYISCSRYLKSTDYCSKPQARTSY